MWFSITIYHHEELKTSHKPVMIQIDFAINISDKKSRRFDLSEVIFKCIKVL